MQAYLLLSLATTALAAKHLALPSTKFVFKPVFSVLTIHTVDVEAVSGMISCAAYYYSTATNANLIGFTCGAGLCMVYEKSNERRDRDQGSIWQIS